MIYIIHYRFKTRSKNFDDVFTLDQFNERLQLEFKVGNKISITGTHSAIVYINA